MRVEDGGGGSCLKEVRAVREKADGSTLDCGDFPAELERENGEHELDGRAGLRDRRRREEMAAKQNSSTGSNRAEARAAMVTCATTTTRSRAVAG
ncbi:hypothetical protein M0R45_000181 [Rubus argutus]|uniref:Uncharacterized protein n=1 Tax=Rubus argutus TaxID=59490 RepID=A0AAW1VQW7_RUBAR